MWKRMLVACLLLIITSGCMFKYESHTGDECLIAVLSGYVEAELDPETGKVTWDRGGWYKASGIDVEKKESDYKIHFDNSETAKLSVDDILALKEWWLGL